MPRICGVCFTHREGLLGVLFALFVFGGMGISMALRNKNIGVCVYY
jgi:hypothetical protein